MAVSGNQPGPHLLIIAGVHGDEYEPILAVERLIEEFGNGPNLDRGQLTLVRVVNEPANDLDARCGPDGKDLARTCPGNPDGSITEQIASEISALIRTADYLIDMHTGGKMYEIYPLTGYVLHPDPQILEKQRKMCQVFGLDVQWGTSPHLDGRTLSVARDAGVPAIYTEYGGGSPARSEIVETLYKGCINVMVDLQLVPNPGLQITPPTFIVEDHRTDSGHLQILYPAPADGRLLAQVPLGTVVHKGNCIARISQPDSDVEQEITALEDGLVFLLNRQSDVTKDASTAGILPITQPGKISIP